MTTTHPRHVVVVGSAGDIGAAIVDHFQALGDRVVGWQRSAPTDSALEVVAVDLANPESIANAATDTLGRLGQIDIVVYAAGWLRLADIDDFDVETWDDMFNVNVRGLFLVAKHLVRPGSVTALIPIGSVAAHVGADESFAYTATKGGARSLSIALAQVFAPATRVVVVSPAWVDGGFTDQVKAGVDSPSEIDALAREVHLAGRMCTPKEVAHVVGFVASEGASFMTGTEVFVDGGFMVKR